MFVIKWYFSSPPRRIKYGFGTVIKHGQAAFGEIIDNNEFTLDVD